MAQARERIGFGFTRAARRVVRERRVDPLPERASSYDDAIAIGMLEQREPVGSVSLTSFVAGLLGILGKVNPSFEAFEFGIVQLVHGGAPDKKRAAATRARPARAFERLGEGRGGGRALGRARVSARDPLDHAARSETTGCSHARALQDVVPILRARRRIAPRRHVPVMTCKVVKPVGERLAGHVGIDRHGHDAAGRQIREQAVQRFDLRPAGVPRGAAGSRVMPPRLRMRLVVAQRVDGGLGDHEHAVAVADGALPGGLDAARRESREAAPLDLVPRDGPGLVAVDEERVAPGIEAPGAGEARIAKSVSRRRPRPARYALASVARAAANRSAAERVAMGGDAGKT